MLNSDTIDAEQSLVSPSMPSSIEIPNAPPVRLQKLDLARNIAIAPDGKRYVVATFDDTRLKQGYTTAVYPQQAGYLTLLRLQILEVLSETPEQAIQRHISLIQTIQRGKLDDIVHS